MKLQIEKYTEGINRLPTSGQQILAHQDKEQIVLYQAYNHQIADYALQNQFLGGSHYSYGRMSWIKPNFLWMMYRCGWASKENQERVLAIWIEKKDFEKILTEAVHSSFHPGHYASHDDWKKGLDQKEVRLQWDPDHDPYGMKIQRRAIQIGMKGTMLETFGRQYIKMIEDITGFVHEQKWYVDNHQLEKLHIPIETVYTLTGEELQKRLGVD